MLPWVYIGAAAIAAWALYDSKDSEAQEQEDTGSQKNREKQATSLPASGVALKRGDRLVDIHTSEELQLRAVGGRPRKEVS